MKKIIFHLDINAFFATAEESIDPSLKTKPIAVSNGYYKKSIISTCNYLARKSGVRSGMKVEDAKALCPNIIFIEPKYDLYKRLSEQFINLIATEFTDKIEVGSIDECYVDVTDIVKNYHNNPEILASQMQNLILKRISLPVSIGISDQKYYAKIASDLKKPLGISTIYSNELEAKFWKLPITDYVGIGFKTLKILKDHQIKTIEDFKNYQDQVFLENLLHSRYKKIMDVINGNIDDDEIDYDWNKRKSISISSTLIKTESDPERVLEEIKNLTTKLVFELNHYKTLGKGVTLGLKYIDEKVRSKTISFKNTINPYNLYSICKDLLFEIWDEKTEIKLISVHVNKLQTF